MGSYFQYAAKLKGAAAWNKGSLWFGKIVAHGAVGGTSSVARGGIFADGFQNVAFTQLGAPFTGAMDGASIARTTAGAVVGGTDTGPGGKKFANGGGD